MKVKNILWSSAVMVSIALATLSCSKKDAADPQPISQPTDNQAKLVRSLKNLKFSFSEAGSGNLNFNPSNNLFEYVEPTTGVKYVQPNTGPNFNEVGVKFSANISSGGGTFKFGNKNIDLNYVVCVSAKDASEFSESFEFITPKANMSMLLGLSGDLESGNIEYAVLAFVASKEASGKFDVISEQAGGSGDFALFSIFDFSQGTKNPKIYLSNDGSLNIKGGNITLADIKVSELGGSNIEATGKLTCE